MKHLKYPAIAFVLVLMAYCKSTKTGSATSATSAPEAKAPAPAYMPSAKQLEVAQKRWPATLPDEISAGQNIYVTKCAECHMAFDIMEFSEKKWIHEIEKMSPKAKLTADEKLKLSKHILSYREANAPVKPN